MTRIRTITYVEAAVAICALAYLLYAAWFYIRFGSYLDHASPHVAIDSWQIANGGKLFLSPDSDEFTITAYGPFLYLLNAFNFSIVGGSIGSSKIPSVVAVLAGVVFFSAYIYRKFGQDWMGFGIILYVGLLLIPGSMSFWVRPDPILVFLVSVALFGSSFRRQDKNYSLIADIVIAICAGLAVNLKIHAPLYFVPLLFAFSVDRWYMRWLIITAIFAAAASVPFALPSINLHDYFAGLSKLAASRSLEPHMLAKALKWSVLFYAPFFILVIGFATGANRPSARDLLYGLALLVSLTIALYPSSVAGAGWYHLLPFSAISIDLCIRYAKLLNPNLWPGRIVPAVLIIGFLVVSATPQKRLHRYIVNNNPDPELIADIHQFLATHRGARVEIGYGSDIAETYKQSYLKVIPVFAGSKSTISSVAVMEMRFSNQPVPEAKLALLKKCSVQYWLIPKGEKPFTIHNYFNGKPAFWPAYIGTFNDHYVKSTQLKYWDVWTCQNAQKSQL